MILKETIENIAGFIWWRLVNISDNVKSYIRGLLTAVFSSAGVERIFSLYDLVQSKLRNRLGNENLLYFCCITKLVVFLFRELYFIIFILMC